MYHDISDMHVHDGQWWVNQQIIFSLYLMHYTIWFSKETYTREMMQDEVGYCQFC